MSETLETTASSASNLAAPASEVELVRLVRLQRDEATHQPSRIYAQITGQYPEGQVLALGHVELYQNDEHLLVPSDAWSAGESVLEALVGPTPPTGDLRHASERIESLVRAQDVYDSEHPVFTGIRRAIEEAYLLFCSGNASTHDQLGLLIDSKSPQVSHYFVAPAPAAPVYQGEPANTFDDAPFIKPLPKDGTKGHLLEREALRYGQSSVRYPNGAFVTTDPTSQKQLAFKWGRSPLASGTALSICSYKEATRRLLKRVDVPVPRGRVFAATDLDQAVEFADRIGYPVVCKPVAGLRGIGVVANIKSRQELEDALDLYRESELGDDDFVIEEHVPGEDYRIVVIGDEVVASVVRAPASVTGDGKHTVADLIEYKNRARLENPHLSSRKIKLGHALEYQLRLANLTYSSVPAAGQVVTLANSANLTQGGDSFEIADELHPSIKELSVKAVNAVPGLGFCGLDMLIEDHTKPVWEQRVTVIELNAHAAIGSAQYPMWGTPAPVARTFFEATLENANISVPQEQSDTLSLHITVRGRVNKQKYRDWFRNRATEFGLVGYIKKLNRARVEAYVSGNADAASALGYLALQGPRKQLPTSVTMDPVPEEDVVGFTVVSSSQFDTFVRQARRVYTGLRRRTRRLIPT